MNPLSHWKRDMTPDFHAVIDGVMDTPTTAAAVFDNRVAAEDFVKAVQGGGSRTERQHLDLDRWRGAVLSRSRHSAATASAIRSDSRARRRHLPNEDVLKLSTMCGHGMVSSSLAKKMIDWVKEGRRTPEQASSYLARFCSCGVFNPAVRSGFLKMRARGRSSRLTRRSESVHSIARDPNRLDRPHVLHTRQRILAEHQ